jgi:hypothetical protein
VRLHPCSSCPHLFLLSTTQTGWCKMHRMSSDMTTEPMISNSVTKLQWFDLYKSSIVFIFCCEFWLLRLELTWKRRFAVLLSVPNILNFTK